MKKLTDKLYYGYSTLYILFYLNVYQPVIDTKKKVTSYYKRKKAIRTLRKDGILHLVDLDRG